MEMEQQTDATAPIFSEESVVDQILQDADTLSPASGPVPDADLVDVVENNDTDDVDKEPVGDEDADLEDAGAHVDGDEERDDATGDASGGAPTKTTKRYFNVITVIGAPKPSENARYAGSSPSVAAKKAALKVWDKSGSKKFTLIMRKVSQQVAGRTLYKYEMTMVKLKDPIGFFNALVPKFTTTTGQIKTNESKRVKIVRFSKDPVFGYVDDQGQVVVAGEDASGQGTLHRSPSNNTLTFNIGDRPMPKQIGTLSVNRTDWQAEFDRKQASDDELNKYDIAGAHKKSVKEADARAKFKVREKETAAKAKARAAAIDAKAKAKDQSAKLSANKSSAKGAQGAKIAPEHKTVRTKVTNATGVTGQPLKFKK
jgi:hypothetical protein